MVSVNYTFKNVPASTTITRGGGGRPKGCALTFFSSEFTNVKTIYIIQKKKLEIFPCLQTILQLILKAGKKQ